MSRVSVMDLRLREVTWVRLLSLLVWTILMMLKRGLSQVIEVIERRVFVEINQTKKEERNQREDGEKFTLLPPLSDQIVLSKVWPLLHERVNVSLLWRLRRVNKAWKRSVSNSLEWAALEMVRVDSPGFLRYLRERRERRPSLQERVESERRLIAVLLAENLVESLEQPGLKVQREPSDKRDPAGAWREDHRAGELTSRFGVGNRRLIDFGGFESGRDDGICWCEESDFEADASSSESSVRVYYPRHILRGE